MEKELLSEDENDAKYQALREFVLESLGKFAREIREIGIRLDNLERKGESGRKRKFREDESDEDGDEKEEIATSIEDLNENIRGKVCELFDGLPYLKEKEKVSKLQLAYIHYWLGVQETRSPTKLVDMQKLITDGVQDRIWTEQWKPDIRGDFASYLQEKVRNIVKKKRALQEKEKLQKELEDLMGY